jgi:hypothetical protein
VLSTVYGTASIRDLAVAVGAVPVSINQQVVSNSVCPRIHSMGEGGGSNCLSGANASFGCDQYGAMGGGAPRTVQILGEQFCKVIEKGQPKQLPFNVTKHETHWNPV